MQFNSSSTDQDWTDYSEGVRGYVMNQTMFNIGQNEAINEDGINLRVNAFGIIGGEKKDQSGFFDDEVIGQLGLPSIF